MRELCHGNPPFIRPCDALTLFGGCADGLTVDQQHVRREALDSIINMNEAPERRMTIEEILAKLPGVRSASMSENFEQGTIHITVDGGDDQEIATAIFRNLPVGTWTEGNIWMDINNGTVYAEVRFSRPEGI
jgi:hypothetical protein